MRWRVRTPEKLLHFLRKELVQSGKSTRRVLEANLCRVNGKMERFASISLREGDVVELVSNWEECLTSRSLRPQIFHENEDLLIAEKPLGWVCSEENVKKLFEESPRLVHRLDKDTSGLFVLAKHGKAQEELMQLFAAREVEKEYLALVDGIPSEEKGIRESLLARKPGAPLWRSSHRGLRAITHWKVAAVGKQTSLLRCFPKTGRTHQIRVHLAEMGHPILVDRQYATSFHSSLFASRYLLHAYRLRFCYKGQEIAVTSTLPPDFSKALAEVGIPFST